MKQAHPGFVYFPPSLAMIACRTSRHHVRPYVLPSQVFGQDMVESQFIGVVTAVLAGIIVPTEYLPSREFHPRAGSMDHLFKPDDGWTRNGQLDRLDAAATIHDHVGFSG